MFAEHMMLTELQRRMQDPAYREAFERLGNAITDGRDVVDRARQVNDEHMERLDELDERIEARRMELYEEAQRLPDGTPIAVDENGNARYFDGGLVPEEQLEGVEVDPNGVSAAELAELNRIQEESDVLRGQLGQQRERIDGYERELDRVEERMQDPDNPYTQDELVQERDQLLQDGETIEVEVAVEARAEIDSLFDDLDNRPMTPTSVDPSQAQPTNSPAPSEPQALSSGPSL